MTIHVRKNKRIRKVRRGVPPWMTIVPIAMVAAGLMIAVGLALTSPSKDEETDEDSSAQVAQHQAPADKQAGEKNESRSPAQSESDSSADLAQVSDTSQDEPDVDEEESEFDDSELDFESDFPEPGSAHAYVDDSDDVPEPGSALVGNNNQATHEPIEPAKPAEPTVAATPQAPKTPPAPQTPPANTERVFGLPAHASKNYLLYSKAPPSVLADISMRLEAMRSDYQQEMKFVFKPNKAPSKAFFIGDKNAFIAAGGHPAAPGVFRATNDAVGSRLLIRNSGNAVYIELSQLLQHEGWHQFCWNHVKQHCPIWLDEGLAHYYSYGVWTGDTTVYGAIHSGAFMQFVSDRTKFIPIAELLRLDDNGWGAWKARDGFWAPYMQSWSLVYFLKHAKGGRHRRLLTNYIKDLAAGRDATKSMQKIARIEGSWKKWINSRRRTSTHVHYFEAIAATLTGHLARAHINGQKFASMKEFLAVAKAGKVNLGEIGSKTWLPPSVMQECIRYMEMFGRAYTNGGKGPFVLKLEKVRGVPAARVQLVKIGLNIRAVAKVDKEKVLSVKISGQKTAPKALQ